MDVQESGSDHPPPARRDALVARISQILISVSGALLLVLFLVNVIQMGARPVMGGWIWVNDLSRLLIAWIVMVGAAAAVGLREHLVIDFVIENAPENFKAFSGYLVRASQIVIGAILLVSGYVVAMNRMNIQYIQLGIPTGYAYMAVAVLGLFMVLFGLMMTVRPPERAETIEDGDDE